MPGFFYMLKGKKILLGITGSIAAYKAATLVRLFVKAGAEVKVVSTPSASQFITPLTLATLSKNEVLSDISSNNQWNNHVMLGRWADIMIIAPLSCNTLSKMSAGFCDNLLMAVYLSAVCPVAVAPAMDEDMWLHPSTHNNLNALRTFGNFVIPVNRGELASGLIGEGRMAEPEEIFLWTTEFFNAQQSLKGKKIMITAGPTYEKIDPVRFIGNHSSGKMGFALAEVAAARGAEVTLISGPVSLTTPSGVNIIDILSAAEMYEACMSLFPTSDIAIMSAAVADYTPLETSTQKIKKNAGDLALSLTKTKDILASLGSIKNNNQILVGFALETENEITNAKNKLINKNANFIVLNSMNDAGAGFNANTNKITIFDDKGNETSFPLKSKKEVAEDIINTITHVQ
jgi:phosphopantothenoylcysteine decarboxylase/phosphopantothenate--cysteine ligase